MKPGVLVISHGSREADWVRLVDDAVESAASLVKQPLASGQTQAGISPIVQGSSSLSTAAGKRLEMAAASGGQTVPVVSSFLEIVEGRLIQDGIDKLEAEGVTDIYVLPLFVSSGSTHVDDIAQAFGQAPVSPARTGELERFRW
ncbi:CbiX/SirB N-terminal domain-containing protein, partial [Paenibacillus sepulcri]|nr:CbiX/SirB N-terminal domain-containing protein [Paenibacillus sepulcri]